MCFFALHFLWPAPGSTPQLVFTTAYVLLRAAYTTCYYAAWQPSRSVMYVLGNFVLLVYAAWSVYESAAGWAANV
eukprot:CAMPEP_0198362786 /NCGR_PEP_ID=MMETSP1450-20131203/147476_1 /TAXON_ID=753684 ORGANISM="Madagascaria erythrocladiodes, Strain CCMP3234" /NCGR_SAMPLE_ID=MMETSP1450 /ASSEMBLY_ACC=CAM_ASM_001115 /LENGTH=74 /DNA_ID=CAMNT_0044070047 /DNA_START=40 /DNA_END=261 /DNA_ORIENTATION=-